MMRNLALAALTMMLTTTTGRAEPAAPSLATVTIGQQIWLARNLEATHFANGDPIPRITAEAAWAAAGASNQPAQSAYANDESRVARDGLLYNYAAISDPRGLCPKGFRVPTDADWATLEATLGKDVAATRMKTRQFWPETENGPGGGTDDVVSAACPQASAPSAATSSWATGWPITGHSPSFRRPPPPRTCCSITTQKSSASNTSRRWACRCAA